MTVHNDFSIEITSTAASYSVRARSAAGHAQTEAILPLPPLELENRLQAVELSLLRGRGGLRRALSENERQAQELGQILFDFLLSGDVRALYDLSRLQSEKAETHLRILLTVEPPELAALPWELLFHSREAEFLALSQSTPIIRASAAPFAQQTLSVTPPLRVLGVVAVPSNWEALDIPQEKLRLENALAPLQQKGLAELVWLEGQTPRALQAAMRVGPWHIIHFIGHGGFDAQRDEGFIVLCDESGTATPLYAVELARLVADHPSLRLVFLNACEGATSSQSDDLTSSAAALVRRSVPAVVAMQYPISDRGAIEFARTFYESLADNLPVEAAVTDARKSVSLAAPHSPEWATPVLFLSSQDGKLFSLEKAVAAPPSPAPSLPRDETPPAQPSGPGFIRALWLLALLTIFAVALWRFWPPSEWETIPTPAVTVPVAAPSVPIATPGALPSPATTPAQTSRLPTPVPGALLQITFDDPDSVRSPAVGPSGVTSLPASVFVPGRVGNGLRFGEARGVVAFPLSQASSPPIDLNQGEIDFWYQPAYDHDPASDDAHALVNAGDWYARTQLRLAVIGRLYFSIFDDSSTSFGVRTSLTRSLWKAGDWVHIRAVWDAAQTNDPIQLYVNDERVDTDSSLRTWQVEDAQLPETLYVGGASNEGILPADGVIDDLIIRARSSAPPVAAAAPLPTTTPISGWARLGESGPEIDGRVYALAVTDEKVYIGGSFSTFVAPSLLTWDRRTGAWGTLGSGITGTVQTLLVDGADVYVGGDFALEGENGEQIRSLARWDGERWNGFGAGLSGLNRGPVAGVAALALDSEKNLYVGGIFTGAGNGDNTGVTARGILRWNRALARWQTMGGDDNASGLVGFSGDSQPVFVAGLAVVGDYLYAGGHFAAIADRNGGSFPNSRNFARWHIPTEQWEGVGRVGSNSQPAVYAIAADGDDIYLGGDFDTIYDEAGTPINAVLLARWNARSREWGGICCINDKDRGRTLANGLISYGTIGIVRALSASEKGLYVAGRFNEAGDQAANNVARYRKGSWARLTMDSPTLGTVSGVNDAIFALSLAGDEVIVGGKFSEFGETKNGSGLARWGE